MIMAYDPTITLQNVVAKSDVLYYTMLKPPKTTYDIPGIFMSVYLCLH